MANLIGKPLAVVDDLTEVDEVIVARCPGCSCIVAHRLVGMLEVASKPTAVTDEVCPIMDPADGETIIGHVYYRKQWLSTRCKGCGHVAQHA